MKINLGPGTFEFKGSDLVMKSIAIKSTISVNRIKQCDIEYYLEREMAKVYNAIVYKDNPKSKHGFLKVIFTKAEFKKMPIGYFDILGPINMYGINLEAVPFEEIEDCIIFKLNDFCLKYEFSIPQGVQSEHD